MQSEYDQGNKSQFIGGFAKFTAADVQLYTTCKFFQNPK